MCKTAVHVSLAKFQADFLPVPKKGAKRRVMPRVRNFKVIEGLRTEKEISRAFTEIVNGKSQNTRSLCPGYKIALSESRWYPEDENHLKVDGALYADGDVPTDERPHWEKQRMLVEFKGGGSGQDPFHDLTELSSKEERRKVFGQVSDYVAYAYSRQQRTALFFLLIIGTKARITRWDHSGTIFSDAFDYVQDAATMRDILWGFSLLSFERQGIDPTAMAVYPDTNEFDLMDELAQDQPTDLAHAEGTLVPDYDPDGPPVVFGYVRRLFAESLSGDWPRYKLAVPTADGDKFYLVGKPTFLAPGVIGRCTRGYVAVDCVTRTFVWLKDTWRPNCVGVTPEGDVLKTLWDARTRNIPAFDCHGDLDQDTLTRQYFEATKRTPAARSIHLAAGPAGGKPYISDQDAKAMAGKKRPLEDFATNEDIRLRHLRHYRLVIRDVCLPLKEFTCGKQLVSVLRDALRAHADAVTSPLGILHRDVSTGNILILPKIETDSTGTRKVVWRGLLTDWELSKPQRSDQQEEGQRGQPERTGTWQFISVHSLDHPTTPMKTEDDLESFFHVFLYNGVRYMRNSYKDVPGFICDYFDSFTLKDGLYKCGSTKRTAMLFGEVLFASEPLEFLCADGSPHPFNMIIQTTLTWFKGRYALARSKPKVLQGEAWGYEEAETLIVAERQRNLTAAARISTHYAILQLLDHMLERPWPPNDKVGDQLVVTEAVENVEIVDAGTEASDNGLLGPWLSESEGPVDGHTLTSRGSNNSQANDSEERPVKRRARKAPYIRHDVLEPTQSTAGTRPAKTPRSKRRPRARTK
ncbi:hypothetical protein BD414DRAFT_468440 [Trametes punicea]|nr:hypothetical protein BD414DRAFT_468440 [Trametes punicea]